MAWMIFYTILSDVDVELSVALALALKKTLTNLSTDSEGQFGVTERE